MYSLENTSIMVDRRVRMTTATIDIPSVIAGKVRLTKSRGEGTRVAGHWNPVELQTEKERQHEAKPEHGHGEAAVARGIGRPGPPTDPASWRTTRRAACQSHRQQPRVGQQPEVATALFLSTCITGRFEVTE